MTDVYFLSPVTTTTVSSTDGSTSSISIQRREEGSEEKLDPPKDKDEDEEEVEKEDKEKEKEEEEVKPWSPLKTGRPMPGMKSSILLPGMGLGMGIGGIGNQKAKVGFVLLPFMGISCIGNQI